jgi:DMSO/TMAO reductase YedYZ molybdopterin-dependent catalytic subunit
MSRFNDKVQAALFSHDHLAATFPPSAITKPFPFNAYYGMADIRTVDAASWRLELSGQIADRRPWSLAQLRELPQQRQITRHICIEGWSAIGDWSGVPFSVFLKRIGADLRAR